MKKLYVKANRQYRRAFQTITTICESNGKKYAVKEAAEPEAKAHIKNMYEHRNFKYPNLILCPCEMKDDQLWFEYISGETLTDRFKDAVQRADKEYFYKLLDDYLDLLKFYDEDYCAFDNSPAFQAVFGDGSTFIGKKAVRNCAFDCTTNNIIIRDEKAYFIDYEWCFDFAIPYDLFVYHCIYTLYDGNRLIFEKFEPFENVLKYLYLLGKNLTKNRDHFMYFILNENVSSSGLFMAKQRYLKSTVYLSQYAHIRAEKIEKILEWYKNRVEELEGAIQYHQANDLYLQSEKDELKKNLEWYKNRVGELEGAIQYHQANDLYLQNEKDELKKNLDWYKNRVEELEGAIQYHQANDIYLQNEINKKEEKLYWCEKQVMQLENKLENQNMSIIQLTETLDKIENSLAWKMLHPCKKTIK